MFAYLPPGRPAAVMPRLGVVLALGLLTANCASSPKVASSGRQVDAKYGVAASRRLYGENDAIPKGGGRNFVGRPYVIAGRTYTPREDPRGYVREGLASWYGTAFHGRETANGEVFDRFSVAAAHPTLPLPSYVRVTNLANGHSMIVRVNDRGPYHESRVMDVSERVAEALEFRRAGTARVRVEYVGKASLRGSDDTKLMATLRTDGRSAPVPGQASVMFAEAPAASARKPVLVAMAGTPESEAAAEEFRPAPIEPQPSPVTRPVEAARPALAFKPEQRSAVPVEVSALPEQRMTVVTRTAAATPARALAKGDPLPLAAATPSRLPASGLAEARASSDAKPPLRLSAPPLRLAAPPLSIVRQIPAPPERPGAIRTLAAPAAQPGRTPVADADRSVAHAKRASYAEVR